MTGAGGDVRTKDAAKREALAQERHRLYCKMGRRISDGRYWLELPQHKSDADRVLLLTTILNGHAYDTGTEKPPRNYDGGGMYEQKRYDRVKNVRTKEKLKRLRRVDHQLDRMAG